MQFFNLVFGAIHRFSIKCEYTSRCAGYKENSYTCTEALDKSYCGIYMDFLQEP